MSTRSSFRKQSLRTFTLILLCASSSASENNKPTPSNFAQLSFFVRSLWAPPHQCSRAYKQLDQQNEKRSKPQQLPRSSFVKFCYVSASITTLGLFCYASYKGLCYLDTRLCSGLKSVEFNNSQANGKKA